MLILPGAVYPLVIFQHLQTTHIHNLLPVITHYLNVNIPITETEFFNMQIKRYSKSSFKVTRVRSGAMFMQINWE